MSCRLFVPGIHTIKLYAPSLLNKIGDEGSARSGTSAYNDSRIKISRSNKFNGSLIEFTYKNIFDSYGPLFLLREEELIVLAEFLSDFLHNFQPSIDYRYLSFARLDLAVDIETNYPFNRYKEVFYKLTLPRTKRTFDAHGYYLYNKSMSFAFYDKGHDLRRNGYAFNGNIMRGELRLFKVKNIRDQGVLCLGTLLDDYSVAPTIFYQYLREIFRDFCAPPKGDYRLELIRKYGYKYFLKFLAAEATKHIPADILLSALSEKSSKPNAYKIAREMQEIRSMGLPACDTLSQLYMELSSKFFSGAASLFF